MKTILVCNQKGGVGKTLISDEIAFALERDKVPFSYFDLDSQGGALHQNQENENAAVQVIDTPGAIQSDMMQWIEASDMIIVPTKLTLRDQQPLETMIKILEPYQKQKSILYVLNGWNRYNASSQFTEWFWETYPDLQSAILSQSELFNAAAGMNESIVDMKPSSTPAQQIVGIYSIVKYALGLTRYAKLYA